MSHEDSLQILSLAGIAHQCAQETDRFFNRQTHDPRYCFELFRRAFLHRNERAWELIYRQYRPLVAGWVERHSAFPTTGEEAQYFVNRAFDKMWSAVPADRFHRFPDLKSLLSYLQMCVHSAIVDEARSSEYPTAGLDAEALTTRSGAEGSSVEDRVLTRAERHAFWDLISQRLKTEQERLVVHGSFVLALKPGEVCAEFPDAFSDVKEVYRIKQNVLDRLRRDVTLQQLLGEGA